MNATDPLIVSRYDVAMEPAPEDEPNLIIGAVADDGQPVALFLDPEARAKVAGWLAPSLSEEVERLRTRLAELEPYAPTGHDPVEDIEYQVAGDWGVDGADTAEQAIAFVRKALQAYPHCGAHAQQRITRRWDDDSEWYGPWTDLPIPPQRQQEDPHDGPLASRYAECRDLPTTYTAGSTL
ncbi:hypothetical protein [Streptomyces gardneri]|uniref:hypothetical protein n=1 Tax=Streptomyces gardneri TaxID=66892 RepID=UPI0036A1EE8D